jgi:hypothetical protein
MTQAKVLLFGLVAGLTLGVMCHGTARAAQVPSLANGNIVMAGDEAQPNTENSSEEDPENSGEDSAKMLIPARTRAPRRKMTRKRWIRRPAAIPPPAATPTKNNRD